MTLTTNTTFNGLPVCPKCGWPSAGPYETEEHRRDCVHEPAGESACELAARLPDLPSTKFGYGTDQLTFEPDKNLHVRFHCNRSGTFKLEEVWLLDDLSQNEAASLMRAIADWRSTLWAQRRGR
jgi:hypothetical protein